MNRVKCSRKPALNYVPVYTIVIIFISLAVFFHFNFLLKGEQSQPHPSGNKPNKKYANVFEPLDGKWKGKFYVYSLAGKPSPKDPRFLRDIDAGTLKKLPLKQRTVIDVQQVYTSETPYLQNVIIKDTYTRADGSKKVKVSKGVNKVSGDTLICIVNKPDETVIHTGRTDGKHTIIWERDLADPPKKEFFKETVEKDRYIIVGWGYYGNDDRSLMPRTWFYGLYRRQWN
jgi:hypothetical protein